MDLLAGTSTGGILGIGLSSGISASDLVDVYSIRAKEIFTNRKITEGLFVHSRYTDEGLRKVLN